MDNATNGVNQPQQPVQQQTTATATATNTASGSAQQPVNQQPMTSMNRTSEQLRAMFGEHLKQAGQTHMVCVGRSEQKVDKNGHAYHDVRFAQYRPEIVGNSGAGEALSRFNRNYGDITHIATIILTVDAQTFAENGYAQDGVYEAGQIFYDYTLAPTWRRGNKVQSELQNPRTGDRYVVADENGKPCLLYRTERYQMEQNLQHTGLSLKASAKPMQLAEYQRLLMAYESANGGTVVQNTPQTTSQPA